MGKVQKIKEERKKEREARIKNKELRKSFLKKCAAIFTVFAILATVGIFANKKYGEQYVKPFTSKIAGVFKGDNNKSNPSKEESKEKGEKKVEAKSYKTGNKKYSQAPDMQIDVKKKYVASFETSKGNFKIELFAEKAPKTVNNFVVLAKDKFYDGLTFHRIIKDFMIQGGDPEGNGTGGPGYKFEDEQNDLALERGVLAMANSGPNTNGSQFFIITKDKTDWLQGKHTGFGKVTEGLDVVMDLEKVETLEGDKPKDVVVVNKVTIEEK